MAKSAAKNTYSPSHQLFLKKYYKRKRSIRLLQLLIILFFLALWEITTRIGLVDSFIFSSPSRVAGTFLDMAADGTIFYHTGITLLETFVSFTIVNVFGIAIAILLWWNEKLAKVLEPYLVVLNSLPKSALAPVFIVWLGNNVKTIIVAAVSVE
ncbi:ABC transporter permease [Anaerocolumna xylanovorans]|uniref:NitT/TauT family transport system permease protein n=1 Tax=Anaerocolumna xylanovorans DSM 12503 TaxID=1121345 RepID=A0A1M7Y3R5_9FIRM|nr:hypothetical protein [Anaerocolumna xylanovorans]SHO46854.1 NitT/TauT family transport system permease protein [Anaerocolumna xylanovorans DSM 12503]